MKLKQKYLIVICVVLIMIGYIGQASETLCYDDRSSGTTGCYPQEERNCVAVNLGGGVWTCVGNWKDDGCEEDERECYYVGSYIRCKEENRSCDGTFTYWGCDYDYDIQYCVPDFTDSHPDNPCDDGTWQDAFNYQIT